jgi:hypothetical protein
VERESRVLQPLQPWAAVRETRDDRRHHRVGQVVQQRPLAAEVPVQRGCLDAEFGRQPAHRELVETLVLQQPQRDADRVRHLDRHAYLLDALTS